MQSVSFLIPTLNSASVLDACLASIAAQDYPKEQIEIVIADGGSTDATLEIAKKFNAKIVKNSLKTGEAGKAVALNASTGELVAFVDSDNILPNPNWLKEMTLPLSRHLDAIGSEPWAYTWRKQDAFITRYCALIGMNDPIVHFFGNYDRLNLLTNKWTEVPHEEQDMGEYLLVTFDKRGIPTIGANGTVFRADILKKYAKSDYLFDIDILATILAETGSINFIKTKNGIIHTFCESDVSKFARKQKRRVLDYTHHVKAGNRNYDWKFKSHAIPMFILYCITVLPLIFQATKGYLKKADRAWFFHILACEITLWEYGVGILKSSVKRAEFDRSKWKQ